MKVKRFSFLLCLLCICICCGIAACEGGDGNPSSGSSMDSPMDSSGNEEKPQTPLTTPVPTLHTDYSITWEDVT